MIVVEMEGKRMVIVPGEVWDTVGEVIGIAARIYNDAHRGNAPAVMAQLERFEERVQALVALMGGAEIVWLPGDLE